MTYQAKLKSIAILGGGPSGLFMFKRLVESGRRDLDIHVFERNGSLGAGMPYSTQGACNEHITNVSDNEIPTFYVSIEDWVKTAPEEILKKFDIKPDRFNEYKVLPRLFFGAYLSAQFDLLINFAHREGIQHHIHLRSQVTDIQDLPKQNKTAILIKGKETLYFDHVIICTGHYWPKKYEGKIPGYFDSPYPPQKLALKLNYPVAIKGASLTAIDAIKTLARSNGTFTEDSQGMLKYELNEMSKGLKIVMHTRSGMLPAVRIHLEDTHLGRDLRLSSKEVKDQIAENDGFLSLDFVFEKNFKQIFIEKDPEFYAFIKDMDLETFVDAMMQRRERLDAFELLKKEYKEAERSIKNREPVHWKEALAILSFTLNYPAKYLSAEDMQRLQKVLMPLISIVIAFVPQSSCKELFALHEAGLLSLVPVGEDSDITVLDSGGATYQYTNENGEQVEEHFATFIDCTGQRHLPFEDFPFKSLISDGTVSPAQLRYRSEDRFLTVPGIAINDYFQVLDRHGEGNNRIYIMAVPLMGGFNPDYSGLDFCEAASESIVSKLL